MKTLLVIALLSLSSYAHAGMKCETQSEKATPVTFVQDGSNFNLEITDKNGKRDSYALNVLDNNGGNLISGNIMRAKTNMGVFMFLTNVDGEGMLSYTLDGDSGPTAVNVECGNF